MLATYAPPCGKSMLLLQVFLTVLALSVPGQAVAQRVPPELQNSPRDQRFVVMALPRDGECPVGAKHLGSSRFAPFCEMTINECLSLAGTEIRKIPGKGNWGCHYAPH